MTAIIAWLLANPTVIAIVGGIAAALGWGVSQRLAGAKSERNKARAKDADAYEQHLEDISGAHDARNRVDPDRLPDNDPYRRD